MDYQLCKDLKDAGFPQNDHWLIAGDECDGDIRHLSHRGVGFHRTWDFSTYPNGGVPSPDNGKGRASIYFRREYLEDDEGKALTVYEPTLSELIEACGDGFLGLTKLNKDEDPDIPEGGWIADTRSEECNCDYKPEPHSNWKSEFGKTPEEAVARLYLALNKK